MKKAFFIVALFLAGCVSGCAIQKQSQELADIITRPTAPAAAKTVAPMVAPTVVPVAIPTSNSKLMLEEDIKKLAGGNDAKATRLMTLCRRLDVQFPETAQEIARQAVSCRDRLKRHGNNQDMEPVLKGISDMASHNKTKASITDYFTAYSRIGVEYVHRAAMKHLHKESASFKAAQ